MKYKIFNKVNMATVTGVRSNFNRKRYSLRSKWNFFTAKVSVRKPLKCSLKEGVDLVNINRSNNYKLLPFEGV